MAPKKGLRPPPAELRKFIAAYDPAVAALFFATREAVLAAAPQAIELIYDAYNALSIAYSFTDRLKEAFVHVAAYPRYVNLGFNRGAALADPQGRLIGSGTNIRHIRVAHVEILRDPAVQSLLRAAVAQGRSLGPTAALRPQSIVKAVFAKKRRPAKTDR